MGFIIVWGKLQGVIGSKFLMLLGCYVLNMVALLICLVLGIVFVNGGLNDWTIFFLIVCTLIVFVIGVHLVMVIGGVDMFVVVSMFNSYLGWVAVVIGFMLNNDFLIVIGVLVGSSGVILSYIMCWVMNWFFLSVILGGFGVELGTMVSGSMEDLIY